MGPFKFILSLLLGLLIPVVSYGQIEVLATTGMIADAVREIGGDHVKVTSLMGPGVDPHLYKASHSDMRSLRKAQIVFYNGLYLEGKMDSILHALGKTKPCVAIASGLERSKLLFPNESPHEPDPHIWFDVSMWAQALSVIRDTLIEVSPENSSAFEDAYNKYNERLVSLHQKVKTDIATIPKNRRVLLTAHDAFGYFGRAYDIEVIGLQGISTATELGLYEVRNIADAVIERKIKAVFVETSVSKRFVITLQKGVEARGGKLTIGGELFSDAMGASGTPEGTYIGMVESNAKTIVSALK